MVLARFEEEVLVQRGSFLEIFITFNSLKILFEELEFNLLLELFIELALDLEEEVEGLCDPFFTLYLRYLEPECMNLPFVKTSWLFNTVLLLSGSW